MKEFYKLLLTDCEICKIKWIQIESPSYNKRFKIREPRPLRTHFKKALAADTHTQPWEMNKPGEELKELEGIAAP